MYENLCLLTINHSAIDIKGGNAANVSYCLAKLGFKVTLFTVADGGYRNRSLYLIGQANYNSMRMQSIAEQAQ